MSVADYFYSRRAVPIPLHMGVVSRVVHLASGWERMTGRVMNLDLGGACQWLNVDAGEGEQHMKRWSMCRGRYIGDTRVYHQGKLMSRFKLGPRSLVTIHRRGDELHRDVDVNHLVLPLAIPYISDGD